jgi:DNA helicase-2/ATP-dependent DNA helicase PcrA
VLVEKIKNSIVQLNEFQGAIALSFTNKSSRELSKKARRGGHNVKASFFGTIDKFCLIEIVFPFLGHLLGKKSTELVCISIKELEPAITLQLPISDEGVLELNHENLGDYIHVIQECFKRGQIILEAVGVLANHVLEESSACQQYIKARYSYIFVDEYQDSSAGQHQLFVNLVNLGLIGTAVGDMQQSIYEWRGGSCAHIQSLIDQNDHFEHLAVNINHRCHPSITNYANRLFNSSSQLLDSPDIRVIKFRCKGTQENVVKNLNTWIPKAMNKFDVEHPKNVGIFVKSNASLQHVINHLDLPMRVYAEDILAARGTNATRVFSALLSYRFNSSTLIQDVLDAIGVRPNITRNTLDGLRCKIQTIRSNIAAEVFLNMVQFVLELDIAISQTDQDVLQSVLQDSDLLSQFLPINNDEIQVMTLHKAKGLEFDVIFHLDLYDWILPRRIPQPDRSEHYSSWKQDLNLHYVGVTRARKACCLVTSDSRINFKGNVSNGAPSQFFELPGLEGLSKGWFS